MEATGQLAAIAKRAGFGSGGQWGGRAGGLQHRTGGAHIAGAPAAHSMHPCTRPRLVSAICLPCCPSTAAAAVSGLLQKNPNAKAIQLPKVPGAAPGAASGGGSRAGSASGASRAATSGGEPGGEEAAAAAAEARRRAQEKRKAAAAAAEQELLADEELPPRQQEMPVSADQGLAVCLCALLHAVLCCCAA